jgi:hypothetical protein
MIRRCLALLSLAAGLWLGAGSSARAEPSGVETLHKIFTQSSIDPALFAPNFLAKIPVSDVGAFVASYVVRVGAPTAIDKNGFEYLITSPRGSIKVNIAYDEQGRISSLLFHDELSADNLSALQRVLSADTVSPDWFQPSYVKDVPTEKLISLLDDMHAKLGKFVRVDTRNSAYIAIFDHGESHAQISADIDGRIDYLAFAKP